MERDDSLRGRGKKEKRKRRKRRQRWARGVTREKIRRGPRDREVWSKSGVINTHSHAVASIPFPW